MLDQVAPMVGQHHGVAKRLLDTLIEESPNVLGEGQFGKVVAVTIGCTPLCIKIRTNSRYIGSAMLKEIQYLKELEGVAGLPRVLGYSNNPGAYIMTRHGTTTLEKFVMGTAENGQAPTTNISALVDILVRLIKIL